MIPRAFHAWHTVSTDDAYVNSYVTFVAPRVPGQVLRVLVDDNNRVKKGDVRSLIEQLVGRNGAGKTTLLRAIAGELEPDAGTIAMPRGYRVALHDQRPPLTRDVTLAGYVGEGPAACSRPIAPIERRMAAGDSAEVMHRYDEAQAALEAAGGYAWRSRLESILRGLGFADADVERRCRSPAAS